MLQIETFDWVGMRPRYIPVNSTMSRIVTMTPIPTSNALSGRELAYFP